MATHFDSTTVDPEEIVLRRHRRRAVLFAIEQLCHEHRTVLVMTHFEDLPQSRVAAELGSPLGTVKSRMAAALRVLLEVNDAPR